MTPTKSELHRIIDGLCEEDAADILVLVRDWLAEEEALTPEEEAEVEQGRAEIAAGEFVDLDHLVRELGR
ncbi:MAG: hypothetical protein ACKVVT_18520 [Dehalococcoidia bacterium]